MTPSEIKALQQSHKSELSAQNALVKLTAELLSTSDIADVPGSVGTTTSEAASLSAITLKNSNQLRKSLKINNDSTGILYVREGTGASTSLYTWRLVPNAIVIIDDYAGIVTGVWDVATGNAVITETT